MQCEIGINNESKEPMVLVHFDDGDNDDGQSYILKFYLGNNSKKQINSLKNSKISLINDLKVDQIHIINLELTWLRQ